MPKTRWIAFSAMFAAVMLALLILSPSLTSKVAAAQTDARLTAIRNDLTGDSGLAALSEAFRKVAKVVEPSVVHVEVFQKRNRADDPRRRMQDLQEWFFGPTPPGFRDSDPRAQPRDKDEEDESMDQYNVPRPSGNGSGWVYDQAGHIVTNYHVVEDADRIVVKFVDGTEHDAVLTGTDRKTDVAVLKIESDNLQPAEVSRAEVEQGELVFAFGSPFGNEFSMSQGIVSAKGRQVGLLQQQQGYENYIQTDAAINPGNSGGPLTNIYGQVVGMNSAIATRTGGFAGIGFAIPSDMVVKVVDQLIEKGKVTRGYLGVYIDDMSAQLAQTYGFSGKGVLVTDLRKDGPAGEAGIQADDIITHVNGKPAENSEWVRESIAAMPPGEKVELTLVRAGKEIKISVVLGELEDEAKPARLGKRAPQEEEEQAPQDQVLPKLGFQALSKMTEDVAEQTGLDFVPGVLVRSVREGSAAWAGGIRRGMIITQVMSEPVDSIDTFVQALKKQDLAKGVRLRISVEGHSRVVLLQLPNN
ncbi:MAG: trypsin-like peptidase domain-containing protein [Phycisphaeraceae bacterium]|nr:trypsin-like peptidase domain-containing protein [Phycisphaeraceae bacterium]